MNREIKFRAKELKSNNWVYGHYTQGSPEHHYITFCDGSVWTVNPETIGQFTGVKDRYGIDIYEGDILCAAFTPYEDGEAQAAVIETGCVSFEDGTFTAKGEPINNWRHGEIMGTEYEFSELL